MTGRSQTYADYRVDPDPSVLITPETHPDHTVVGRRWRGPEDRSYFCESYDPRIGFWMVQVDPKTGNPVEPENRRNVSEKAIGGTYRVDVWAPSAAVG